MESLATIPPEKEYDIQTTDLIHFMKSKLTEDEQLMFGDSFYLYLNYDCEADFVIDLEDVYKWVGYTRKDTAKDLLRKEFECGVNYVVKAAPVQSGAGGSGKNKETILLNVDTFKEFCSLARTDQGKKIRKYYIKLEKINMDYIKHSLHESNKLLAEKDEQIKRLEKPAFYPIYKNEYNYVFQENTQKGTNIFKYGLALDISKRKKPYKTHNSEGVTEMFRLKTHNCALVERVVKQVIHKYKYGHPDGGTEFYDIQLEYLINIIKTVGAVLDTLFSTSDNITKPDLVKHILNDVIKGLYDEDSYKSFLPSEILTSFQETFDKTHKKLKKAMKTSSSIVDDTVVDNLQTQMNIDIDKLLAEMDAVQTKL